MSFQEKPFKCSDCGKAFPFTVKEQEFFASEGLYRWKVSCGKPEHLKPACVNETRLT